MTEADCVICNGRDRLELCEKCRKSYDRWNNKISDGTTWSLIAWVAKRTRAAIKRKRRKT